MLLDLLEMGVLVSTKVRKTREMNFTASNCLQQAMT
jgi:hypothetical protein